LPHSVYLAAILFLKDDRNSADRSSPICPMP
jgi:hypothetical protein